MFKDALTNYISQQVFISTGTATISGILNNVTDNLVVVRTVYPGYGETTDYVIGIDKIAYVRLFV